MEHKSKRAHADLESAKKAYAKFLQIMEETYDGNQAGLKFFHSQQLEEQTKLQCILDEEQMTYNKEEERANTKKEDVCCQICIWDKRLKVLKAERAGREHKKAVLKMDSPMGRVQQ
ncbi:hypothetical protein RSOLAG1IB_08652 [Rhizoctonia solani AG-1 IB]|uniref:Uncharacterized protein n=1 Tax=Thanatephorus cucumeris (strain AG1-IB / isolate 7/3/14) TaxID=1108050 RepID=A0A0B7FKW8_THACB|nr:hypothetical protein RSOLAG1IB_08652 [Rhizoctonia solani AG-1 IB]